MKVYHREERVVNLLEENNLDENAVLAVRCGFEDAHIKEDGIAALKENKDYLTVLLTRK